MQDIGKADDYSRYAKFEAFAYRMLKMINPGYKQESLNIFDEMTKPQALIKLVRNAMKSASAGAYNLNGIDASVAEESMFYFK